MTSDLDARLATNRDAVAELAAAGMRTGERWTVPRAPGKWSPSQVVEHVARALDESANLITGKPVKFPTIPFFLRPVVRGVLFNRVVKNGVFPTTKTNKPMNPVTGPPSPAEGQARLDAALARFEEACKSYAPTGRMVDSKTFGAVGLVDFIRFTEVHTRHHRTQITA